jgi:hypothetical protein
LARFTVHDFMLVRALWLAARRRVDVRTDETPVRYGGEILLVLWVVLVVDGGLLLLLHLTLPWVWVRRALFVLGIAGTVWLLAFLVTFYVYPHAVGGGRIRLRFAALRDYTVPAGAVRSVTVDRRRWDIGGTAAVVDGGLVLPVQNSTNVSITLDVPVDVVTTRGSAPVPVTAVSFSADDPSAARALIETMVSRR